MICTIKNEHISVDINTQGAELWSIKKDDTEYLWQGDDTYWANRATTLFPYIARLKGEKYKYNKKEYTLPIHGFAKLKDFVVRRHEENELILEIREDAETLEQYPFDFSFKVTFSLKFNILITRYTVENKDGKTMYFGVGGHPGFNVPLEEGFDFEDYRLEFTKECDPTRVCFDENKLVNGKTEKLGACKAIALTHDLFDQDAMLFTDVSKEIKITADGAKKGITVNYPSMDYLAIWHKPETEAPYVCIEPWTSSPGRNDRIEDITKQENLISLEPKKIYENIWTIEVN